MYDLKRINLSFENIDYLFLLSMAPLYNTTQYYMLILTTPYCISFYRTKPMDTIIVDIKQRIKRTLTAIQKAKFQRNIRSF